jgi:hypothetical protein
MFYNVFGLKKLAIFSTNVDAENQTLINHKCVCGALNRQFCQTRIANLNINSDYNIKITELPNLDNGYKSKSFQETSFSGIIWEKR